ncbi:MAG: protein-L-isoaspartate(D-aspartate) O-methyltransferase [Chloroflexota bacterium]
MFWRRHQSSPPEPDRYLAARERMVATQLEARSINDPELLRAFRSVPRHAFVEDEALADEAYADRALPAAEGQTMSQPYVVATMTIAARPSTDAGYRGAQVLEVGTGSGYAAAILAELGANVTSIERHAALSHSAGERLAAAGYGEAVQLTIGDGTQGWPPNAPYRSILVTAGGPQVPQPLLDQLDRDGGRLVLPVGGREHQVLTLIERHGDDLERRELEGVVFVPLIGSFGVPE